MELEDIDINNEDNDWDPINREFAEDLTITSLPNGEGYNVVELDRDELAYKQQINLTGYCTAENDENNNLWVTMESPFLTKKIKQKFPQLPGYSIPENQSRAVGDTEIEITSNGTYTLGQNDQDQDDLEIDEDNNLTSNQQQSLILSKTGTRDTIPTFTLGTFTVNVPQTLVNNYTQSTITTNGTYTIPSGYTGFNGFTVNVSPKIYIKEMNINGTIIANENVNSDWTFFNNSGNSTISQNDEFITIQKKEYNNILYYIINYIHNFSVASFSHPIQTNTWVYKKNISSASDGILNLLDENNEVALLLNDVAGFTTGADRSDYLRIKSNLINFDSYISWMTFN